MFSVRPLEVLGGRRHRLIISFFFAPLETLLTLSTTRCSCLTLKKTRTTFSFTDESRYVANLANKKALKALLAFLKSNFSWVTMEY